MKPYKITILTDYASWITPWIYKLKDNLVKSGHEVQRCFFEDRIEQGDFLFILGYSKIVSNEVLAQNKLNLVVHESALPLGRGWSPVQYQILQNCNEIPICLFEATDKVDAGDIWLRDTIELDGTELLPEIRMKQGKKIIGMVQQFLSLYPNLPVEEQKGIWSYYPRRTEKDDRLDVNHTLAYNFNHFRIVDNECYPAFFNYRGHKYKVKIYKEA